MIDWNCSFFFRIKLGFCVVVVAVLIPIIIPLWLIGTFTAWANDIKVEP